MTIGEWAGILIVVVILAFATYACTLGVAAS